MDFYRYVDHEFIHFNDFGGVKNIFLAKDYSVLHLQLSKPSLVYDLHIFYFLASYRCIVLT